MCVACRIDDDALSTSPTLLYPGNQLSFPIGLPEVDADIQLFRILRAELLDVVKRRSAVDLRLAEAEHVQVGTVENGDEGTFHNCAPLARPFLNSKSLVVIFCMICFVM